MGGPINFVFRNTDGSVHFQEIYTGGMRFLQSCPKVYQKQSVLSLLKEWYGKRGKYNYKNGVFPGGYGLFVIDYVKEEMYGIQGYTDFGQVLAVVARPFHEECIPHLNHYIKENRVTKMLDCGEVLYPHKKDIIQDVIDKHKDRLIEFKLDMSPIKIMRFQESKLGYSKLKTHMKKAGFIIDENNWKEYVKDQYCEC